MCNFSELLVTSLISAIVPILVGLFTYWYTNRNFKIQKNDNLLKYRIDFICRFSLPHNFFEA